MRQDLPHLSTQLAPKVRWSVVVDFGKGWSAEGTLMARNEIEVRRAVIERFGDAAGPIQMKRID